MLPSTVCGALAIVGPVTIVLTISHFAATAVCPTKSTTCAGIVTCVLTFWYKLVSTVLVITLACRALAKLSDAIVSVYCVRLAMPLKKIVILK